MCVPVCLFVCISARISQKPMSRSLAELHQIFVHVACGCCSIFMWWDCDTWYIIYIHSCTQICRWRRIFLKDRLCGASCAFLSGTSVIAETSASIPTKFRSAIKISEYRSHRGRGVLSVICHVQCSTGSAVGWLSATPEWRHSTGSLIAASRRSDSSSVTTTDERISVCTQPATTWRLRADGAGWPDCVKFVVYPTV